MKLFIPPLGTRLRLRKPWTFSLMREYRNRSLWDLFGPAEFDQISHVANGFNTVSVTLTPGDILTVSRIFIRKGSKDYDSVTFAGQILIDGVVRRVRFWAHLADANKLEVDNVERLRLG